MPRYSSQFERAVARFHESTRKHKGSGCWQWEGRSIVGVPVFRMPVEIDFNNARRTKFRFISAQTVALFILGKCALGDTVVPHCGNKFCVNPDHLTVTKKESGEVVLVSDYGYNHEERSKSSPGNSVDAFLVALRPLRNGESVVLTMDDPKLKVIKKIKGPTQRLVVLTPGPSIGASDDRILVSVVGSGSAIVQVNAKPKVADLVLAGMPAKLAVVLMDKVHRIFQEY